MKFNTINQILLHCITTPTDTHIRKSYSHKLLVIISGFKKWFFKKFNLISYHFFPIGGRIVSILKEEKKSIWTYGVHSIMITLAIKLKHQLVFGKGGIQT